MALSRDCLDEKRRLTFRSALLDSLGEMRALFAAVLDVATDKTKAATLKDMETTLRHMREMTKNTEHEMHAIVLSCKRARKHMLAALPATKPSLH